MAKASKSGVSDGSAEIEAANDDETDTTLSESLPSSEVCSLTLDSNGEPVNKNLADLAKKRRLGCNKSPRFVVLMVLGCTALAGVVCVAGWAGVTKYSSSRSVEAHQAVPQAAPEAAPLAAVAAPSAEDRAAQDDDRSKEIILKETATTLEADGTNEEMRGLIHVQKAGQQKVNQSLMDMESNLENPVEAGEKENQLDEKKKKLEDEQHKSQISDDEDGDRRKEAELKLERAESREKKKEVGEVAQEQSQIARDVAEIIRKKAAAGTATTEAAAENGEENAVDDSEMDEDVDAMETEIMEEEEKRKDGILGESTITDVVPATASSEVEEFSTSVDSMEEVGSTPAVSVETTLPSSEEYVPSKTAKGIADDDDNDDDDDTLKVLLPSIITMPMVTTSNTAEEGTDDVDDETKAPPLTSFPQPIEMTMTEESGDDDSTNDGDDENEDDDIDDDDNTLKVSLPSIITMAMITTSNTAEEGTDDDETKASPSISFPQPTEMTTVEGPSGDDDSTDDGEDEEEDDDDYDDDDDTLKVSLPSIITMPMVTTLNTADEGTDDVDDETKAPPSTSFPQPIEMTTTEESGDDGDDSTNDGDDENEDNDIDDDDNSTLKVSLPSIITMAMITTSNTAEEGTDDDETKAPPSISFPQPTEMTTAEGSSGDDDSTDDDEDEEDDDDYDDDDDTLKVSLPSIITMPMVTTSNTAEEGTDDDDDNDETKAPPSMSFPQPTEMTTAEGSSGDDGDDDSTDDGGDEDDEDDDNDDEGDDDDGDDDDLGVTQPTITTTRPVLLEVKDDLKRDFHAVEDEIVSARKEETEETKEEIDDVVEDVGRKLAKVEKLENEVRRVNGLDEEVRKLIRDEKAGQGKVEQTEKEMESYLGTLVEASEKLIEGTKFEEKRKNLEELEGKLADEKLLIADEESKVASKEVELKLERNDIRKKEAEAKEIERKQSQLAKVVAEKEEEAEEMQREEEKREEREDERERNENEREKIVGKIEKRVEESDLAVIDEEKPSTKESEFKEKRKDLVREQRELAEEKLQIGDEITSEERKKAELRLEQSDVWDEKEKAKEIAQKETQLARVIAEEERHVEKKEEREDEREEVEDEREKNVSEREKMVERLEVEAKKSDLGVGEEENLVERKQSRNDHVPSANDSANEEMREVIHEQKAGQEKINQSLMHIESNLEKLVTAGKKENQFEEKQKKLDEEQRKFAERKLQIGDIEDSDRRKKAELKLEQTDLQQEKEKVREIAHEQSLIAEAASNSVESNAAASDITASDDAALDVSDATGSNKAASGVRGSIEAASDAAAPIATTSVNATSRDAPSNATTFNASSTETTSSPNGTSSNAEFFSLSSYIKFLHHRKKYRQRDFVASSWRDPEQNYGGNLLEGDIRISNKYLRTQISRKLRELADLGDYVDVVEEDMAHLGNGEKCNEKANGTNVNVNALKEDVTSHAWEGGQVRYAFATNYTTEERHTILDAMNDLAEKVNDGSEGGKCITYTPYDPDRDAGKEYVWFYPGEGCESPVGAPHDEGNRHVSLASTCMERGVVQHELIHILGFWHEQSRIDRDQYVDILWENIEDGICDNFKMYADPIDDHLGLPYDLRSIMHYKSTAFSKNGQNTIVPKDGMDPSLLGQRDKPSEIDLLKVRLRYNCTRKKHQSEYIKLLKLPAGPEEVEESSASI